ncbi:MAG TPA: hypothetical protein VF501_01520, partial [Thiobacillus sp.]
VTLKEGDPVWLPSQYRIGLHPNPKEDPYERLSGFCSVERKALMKEVHKRQGKGEAPNNDDQRRPLT